MTLPTLLHVFAWIALGTIAGVAFCELAKSLAALIRRWRNHD